MNSVCFAEDSAKNIGLKMQYQETDEWCWIAVATSIKAFYDNDSDVTQCGTMTNIGHSINHFSLTTSAYPSFSTLAKESTLAAILADPYKKNALNVLDNHISKEYRKSGGVGDSLSTNGNLQESNSSLTLDEITTEMKDGRPIAVDIAWKGGGQHCVAIAGVDGDTLLILDPIYGESKIKFKDFPEKYQGGASIVIMCMTKK
jgi:hypothetical protein